MRHRTALAAAIVLAGLVIAVVGVRVALHLIGSSTLGPGGSPLSHADVRRELGRQPAAVPPGQSTSPASTGGVPAPARSGSPGSAPTSAARGFPSAGGTVFAYCSAGQVTLTTWSPAPGYRTDGVLRGPARSAWAKFKSGSTELTVTATCAVGRPHFTVTTDESGGGRGGRGGSGGGSGH